MKAASLLGRARKSRLAQNTLWMFLGHGMRLPIQAVYFVLIARALGPQGYGAFVGVTACVAIAAPFVSLGSGYILIKNVARDAASFRRHWGKTLALTILSGVVLSAATLLLSHVLLPASIPLALVLSVCLADLIFTRVLDASAQAFQAFQRLGRTSLLMVVPNISRLLLLAGLLLFVGSPSPTLWGYFYLAGIVFSSLIGVYLANRELGRPVYDRRSIFAELKEGLYFSIGLSSQNIYNDIDKTMLARLATLDAAGIYGAAYRILDVSFTPIKSLLSAANARFFQSGESGISGSHRFAVRLLPSAVLYGLLASACLYLAAPVLPRILGNGYQDTVGALRWLSLLPLLKVLHYFASDTLTGSGFQGLRSICQLATAALNVLLILWLIPSYSWKGAAWASLASDSFLVITTWALVLWLRRREISVQVFANSKVEREHTECTDI